MLFGPFYTTGVGPFCWLVMAAWSAFWEQRRSYTAAARSFGGYLGLASSGRYWISTVALSCLGCPFFLFFLGDIMGIWRHGMRPGTGLDMSEKGRIELGNGILKRRISKSAVRVAIARAMHDLAHQMVGSWTNMSTAYGGQKSYLLGGHSFYALIYSVPGTLHRVQSHNVPFFSPFPGKLGGWAGD